MLFSRLIIQLNFKQLNLSSWLEYSKNGDSLVFDLGKATEDKVLSKKHTTLVCEVGRVKRLIQKMSSPGTYCRLNLKHNKIDNRPFYRSALVVLSPPTP